MIDLASERTLVNATLQEGIDWIGYVDWIIRNFHGREAEHGTTYHTAEDGAGWRQ